MIKEIHVYMEELLRKMKQAGYVPDTRWALVKTEEVDRNEKERRLLNHSEKLAVAFGLISTEEGVPIMIVKNLRICGECHNAIKHISAITGREITVRDTHRFHCFKEGQCSCRDYWLGTIGDEKQSIFILLHTLLITHLSQVLVSVEVYLTRA